MRVTKKALAEAAEQALYEVGPQGMCPVCFIEYPLTRECSNCG